MVKLKYWKVITILFKIFWGISASTHWVVTENGKIQSQLDSPFYMRRPYDLLSLLEQERRADEIERLYLEMIRRKTTIDDEWAGLESATDLEARLYSSDSDCLQAGRPLSDVDLYTSVADDGVGQDGIDLEELVPTEVPPDTPDQPDCAALIDLNFSMRTFPHLQVLSWNLTTGIEVLAGLKSLSDRTGQQIAAALHANHTSWFLHNLAALYWRTQGNAWHALQCAKRAVHLSPRRHRNVALLNLGCIVQQARCPAEAAILLHAAVDHAPQVAASHFALANVYAILGDYNRSVACYDNALKLKPHWSTAARNRFAVLCHHKLESSLHQLHRSLQGVLGQLHEHHSLQEQWLKHQNQLMYQQAPLEVRLQDLQNEPLTALLSHRGDKCVPQLQGGSTVLSCDSKLLAHHLQIDVTMSLQMLLKNVEAQAQKISKQMSWRPVAVREHESPVSRAPEPLEDLDSDDDGEGNLEIFVESVEEKPKEEMALNDKKDSLTPTDFTLFKHPKLRSLKDVGVKLLSVIEELMKNQNIDGHIRIPEQHCKSSNFNTDCSEDVNHWLVPNVVEDEAKQFSIFPIAKSLGIIEEGSWLQNTSSHVIATLIITCIELTQWDSSEIPSEMQEPLCSTVPQPLDGLTADSFPLMRPEPRLSVVFPPLLLEDNASLTDFTTHLSHALKDLSRHNPSSSWLLETVAALYWRCVANTKQMVFCLQAAVHKAPPHIKDFPLHYIAYILLTLGHREEALVLASLAIKISPSSIKARNVLFHTYLALGEPENAKKYGKASLDLLQQKQLETSP